MNSATTRILLSIAGKDKETYLAEIQQVADHIQIAQDAREIMYLAVVHQPSVICIVGHTTDMDLASLLRLLQWNVLTAAIPIVLVSLVAVKDDLDAQGVATDRIKLITTMNPSEWVGEAVAFGSSGGAATAALIDAYRYDLRQSQDTLEGLRQLASGTTIVKADKGDVIYSKGGEAGYIYYLYDGQLLTYTEDAQQQRLVHAIHGMGDWFGVLPVLTSGIYEQTCVANQASTLMRIPVQAFYSLFNSNMEFVKGLSVWLARSQTDAQYHMLNITYGNARSRLAHALIRLHCKTSHRHMSMSRAMLGSMAGMAKETVVRTLSRFKAEGLIDIVSADIILKQVPALRALGK